MSRRLNIVAADVRRRILLSRAGQGFRLLTSAATNFGPACVAFVASGLLSGLTGCSTAKNSPAANQPAIVWPAAPERARIRFVQAATKPVELGAKVGKFRRVSNWITGGETGNEAFVKPFSIAVDSADGLCVTDTATRSVGWLDPVTKRWHQWNRLGKLRFASPVSVAKSGEILFVSDSTLGEVVAFNTKGVLQFRLKENLVRPVGLAIHGERLYVADSQQHKVVVFGMNGERISEFGKRGNGDGDLNFPTHIAVDEQGLLYVTDSMNSRVQVLDANGGFVRQIGSIGDSPGHFSRPKGVAVDHLGHVFVVDAMFDCLQIFNSDGRMLLSLGQAGQGAGEFWLPNGVAVSRDNRIYVADSYNRRVQVFEYLDEP